jgi:hypothetical protein
VLVHGEFERNDMVKYFGEPLGVERPIFQHQNQDMPDTHRGVPGMTPDRRRT